MAADFELSLLPGGLMTTPVLDDDFENGDEQEDEERPALLFAIY